MTPAARRAIYERDGGLCGFCGEPVPEDRFHIDHATPRAMGGSNDTSNLRLAHVRCNIAAGSKVHAGTRSTWNVPMAAMTLNRLPVSTVLALREIATMDDRSLNYVAARVLRRGLDELRREGWADAQD